MRISDWSSDVCSSDLMKNTLRLVLPPLAQVAPDCMVAFALHDRHGRLLRSGLMPLIQLAQAMPTAQAQVILHPGDAIVTTIRLPPLPAKRLDAAEIGNASGRARMCQSE